MIGHGRQTKDQTLSIVPLHLDGVDEAHRLEGKLYSEFDPHGCIL